MAANAILVTLGGLSISISSASPAAASGQNSQISVNATALHGYATEAWRARVLTLEQYAGEVHATRLALDRLANGSRTADVTALSSRLQSLQSVRLVGGSIVRISLPRFYGSLSRATAAELRRVAREIDALDAALRSQRVAKTPPGQLASLDTILRESRFHPTQNIFQRFGAWLWRPVQWLLARVRSLLQGVQPGGDIPGAIVLGISALLLLAVAALAFFLAQATLGRIASGHEVAAGGAEPASATAASALADEFERTGDYRSALRYVILATLLELRDRGLLDVRLSLTNREHLHLFRAKLVEGPAGTAFAELVDIFDSSWYGHRPVEAALYQHACALSQRVVRTSRELSA